MLKCSNCGQINDAKAKFCENCGTELRVESPPKPNYEIPVKQAKKRWNSMKKSVQSIQIKKMSRMKKIILVEFIFLILILGIYIGVGNYFGDPAYTAKKYFEAYYIDRNLSEAYDYLDFSTGKFLTREAFINQNREISKIDVTNYKVDKKKSYLDLLEDYDLPFYEKPSKLDETASEFIKSYTVQYTLRGDSTPHDFDLQLIRQNKKTLLFFPTWKISAQNLVANHFCVSVPKGSTLRLDGIPLTESDKQISQLSDSYTSKYDRYYVDVFTGAHHLEVTAPWKERLSQDIIASAKGDYKVEQLEFTGEAVESMGESVKMAMESMYNAAIEGQAYETLSNLFPEDYQDQNRSVYKELLKDLSGQEDKQFIQITLSDFEAEVTNSYTEDEIPCVKVNLSYHYQYQYNYKYKSWYGAEEQVEQKEKDGTASTTSLFILDGNQYRLASFDLKSVFY